MERFTPLLLIRSLPVRVAKHFRVFAVRHDPDRYRLSRKEADPPKRRDTQQRHACPRPAVA
jgi:hypothetical protein